MILTTIWICWISIFDYWSYRDLAKWCNLWSVCLDGYELIKRHRPNKIGGGIGFFVKTGVSFEYNDDLTIFGDHCDSLFIVIDKSVFGSGRDLLIAVIYRPSNTDIKLFIDVLKDVLEKLQLENKLLYLMGDYNINRLNVDPHSLTADFNDTMYSSGLIPLITHPTRVTENSATLIDNIFTNKVVSYDESVYEILATDISDHYPIFCVDKILKHKTIDVSFVRRDYSEKNKSSFLKDLSLMNWQDVYSTANTQCAFSLFHKKMIDLHDNYFPEKSFTKRYHTRKPWLTTCLREAIKKKNKLYYKSIKIKCMRTKRKSKYYTVINYGNWWELGKRNTTLTESWKTKTIRENYGQIMPRLGGGGTYKANLSKLQILQNKAVRIVTGSSRRCNTENMYRYNKIMNLDCINTYLKGRFMCKIYYRDVPDIFYDLFMYNYHIHDYYTRVSSHLHVPLASTNLSKIGIRYQEVIVWNKILTADINPDCSELSFKVMLKKCINQELI